MQLPLNVSPVSASFFGLKRLGIHLVLNFACSCLGILFVRDTIILCFNSADLARSAKMKKDLFSVV
jgi:hypothetical protein